MTGARTHWAQSGFLALYQLFYERAARPLIFRRTPRAAHEQALNTLGWLDDHAWTHALLKAAYRLAFPEHAIEVGGVRLPHPLILAAGLVKGAGFANEDDACQAVSAGQNIIPGWRSLPLLVGAVEFGSFTRCPRLGNDGIVLWRDEPTHSTQNRVGLKNPGAQAAAAFLGAHQAHLPPIFGINLAVSPGVTDSEQEQREIREAVAAFLAQGVKPSWFTLNLSCPNTDDDPGSHQTEHKARLLCQTMLDSVRADAIPLWVKVSPGLAAAQYQTLMRVFAEIGVRAVIATNTLAAPVEENPALVAGMGGRRLHPHAIAAVRTLMQEKQRGGYPVDVIACGGVENGTRFNEFERLGVKAMQYWTALVYRGPLAAAVIEHEAAERKKST